MSHLKCTALDNFRLFLLRSSQKMPKKLWQYQKITLVPFIFFAKSCQCLWFRPTFLGRNPFSIGFPCKSLTLNWSRKCTLAGALGHSHTLFWSSTVFCHCCPPVMNRRGGPHPRGVTAQPLAYDQWQTGRPERTGNASHSAGSLQCRWPTWWQMDGVDACVGCGGCWGDYLALQERAGDQTCCLGETCKIPQKTNLKQRFPANLTKKTQMKRTAKEQRW